MNYNVSTCGHIRGAKAERFCRTASIASILNLITERQNFTKLVLVLMAVSCISTLAVPAVAQTGWLDPAWSYRTQVTVGNPGGTVPSNLQVKVALDSSFAFANAQTNGADLRVTDADGVTTLPFWVEKWDAPNGSATVWVNVPSIGPAGEVLYFYYGNPSATSASSGTSTFDFFDDFDTGASQQLGFFQLSAPISPMPLLQDQAWESDPPHTLSVVEANAGGFQYWGYYGLAGGCGGIGLAMSNDLNNWTKFANNPLFMDGRWPSMLVSNGVFYMAYEKDYCADSYIELATSNDGVNFTDVKTLVPSEAGLRNQNPHLWLNPNDNQYYLYYYRGNDLNNFDIRVRSASTILGLDAASSTTIVHSTDSLAAPNMLYDGGTYYLATESRNPHTSVWETNIYTSLSPNTGFAALPGNPVLSPGACMFQHVFGTTMHAFYCDFDHINNIWTLKHRTADLTAPRNVFYALDTSKWSILGGGSWFLTSDTQQDGSTGFVVQGTMFGNQILYAPGFNGSDYVLEAYGKQVGGRVWGLGARVTDQNNLYSFNLYDDLNSTNNLYAYSWLSNSQTGTLGSAAVGQVDPNAWYKLTVKAHGTSIDVYKDNVLQIQTSDSTFSSGSIALYGEAQTVARFNNVLVRKYVPMDPAVTVNPVSEQASFAMSLNPLSVQGGSSSQGTVSLSTPAPVGGAVITLSSSNAAIATVPASVTIPQDATSAIFAVSTSVVASSSTAVISGTYNGTTLNDTLTVLPSPVSLASLGVNPASIVGGASSIGTITLTGVAPAGGVTVTLSSNNAAAQVAPSVSVPPGSSTVTFPVTTSLVASSTSITLSATYGANTQTATLTVTPVTVASMTMNPTTVSGGSSSTGTVTLNAPAAIGGYSVALSSNNAAVQVPASVTVPANATSATFTATTTPVGATTSVTLTASFNGSSQSSALSVTPAGVTSVVLSPTTVVGGISSTGTVTLTSPAPAGGALVSLSSNNVAAQVPATVTVVANATTATFTVSTSNVTSTQSATITATYSGSSRTAVLSVTQRTVSALAMNPTSVVGGLTSTGTVTLSSAAPTGGAVVTLSSNSSAAPVPASVTVAANATTATFTITTSNVTSSTTATITATYNGSNRTATLTVTPRTVSSVTLNPTSVVGGNTSTGTVTLSSPAPSGGAVVSLSSNNSAAPVPASVTVAANAATATFTITTVPVTSTATATITATYNGSSRTATLSVTTASLTSLTLSPPQVKRGRTSTATVTINGNAPAGGARVTLSSSNALVATVPSSVTIPAGTRTATFTVTASSFFTGSATISGTYNGTKTAVLTVTN